MPTPPSMVLHPATSARYHLETVSIPPRKTINGTKLIHEQEKKASVFTDIIQPIIAELIGTTFFLLVGLLGACGDSDYQPSLVAGISFGGSLAIFVATFGRISGGHFNPAVTLGMFIVGAIDLKKGLLYVLMQLIGGAMAAGIFRLLSRVTTYHRCHGGATFLVSAKAADEIGLDRIDWWEGLSLELLLSFVFVTAVLMVSVDRQSRSPFAPLYTGTALCGCILASNSLTGGSLNPARSLGSALFANVWSHHYIYWVGPLCGASIAGGAFRFLWGTRDHQFTVGK